MNTKPPCLCSILLIIDYHYHLIRHSNLTIKFKISTQLDKPIYFISHVASVILLENSHYIHFHIYGTNGLVWFRIIHLEHIPSTNWKHISWVLTIALLNAPMVIVMTVAQSKCYTLLNLMAVYFVMLRWCPHLSVLCYIK